MVGRLFFLQTYSKLNVKLSAPPCKTSLGGWAHPVTRVCLFSYCQGGGGEQATPLCSGLGFGKLASTTKSQILSIRWIMRLRNLALGNHTLHCLGEGEICFLRVDQSQPWEWPAIHHKVTLPMPVLKADSTYVCIRGSWEGSSSLGLTVRGGLEPHRSPQEQTMFSSLGTACCKSRWHTKGALYSGAGCLGSCPTLPLLSESQLSLLSSYCNDTCSSHLLGSLWGWSELRGRKMQYKS